MRFPGAALRLGYGLLFLSLFLSGVWHGSTAGFAVFGAIHGLGAAANRVYGDVAPVPAGTAGLQGVRAGPVDPLAGDPGHVALRGLLLRVLLLGRRGRVRILATAGLALLAGPAAWTATHPGLFAAEVVSAAAALLLAIWYRDAILSRLDRLVQLVMARPGSLYAAVLVKTLFVAVLLVSLWGLEKEPEVVYMRF